MLFKTRLKRLAKTALAVLLFIGMMTGAVLFLQYSGGHSYIVKAEEALSADDYEKASEYLKEISPKSKYYPQAQSLLNDITTEQKYRKIAELCHFDKSFSPDTSKLYENVRDNYAAYLQKLVDEEKYEQALYIIENTDPSLKTEAIEETERAIRAKLEETTQSPPPLP